MSLHSFQLIFSLFSFQFILIILIMFISSFGGCFAGFFRDMQDLLPSKEDA